MVNKTGAPILRVKNVSKTFGGVVCALDDVSLEVYPNEIVGVVGENGAGKTTLMKILVGIHTPDRGEWEHNGVVVPFPRDPKEAARKGISIVYQEKGVIPSLKVYQFLFLGNEKKYGGSGSLQIGRMKQHAREILEEFHVQCSIEDFMYELPLSIQKMVEITKAVLSIRLAQNKDTTDSVIILDEPTAPLTIEERRDTLGEILRMKNNTSFVYVTHIMQEVMEYMDEVIVLRDGKRVGYFDMSAQKATEDDLSSAIVGRKITHARERNARGRRRRSGALHAGIDDARQLLRHLVRPSPRGVHRIVRAGRVGEERDHPDHRRLEEPRFGQAAGAGPRGQDG